MIRLKIIIQQINCLNFWFKVRKIEIGLNSMEAERKLKWRGGGRKPPCMKLSP